jgi:hypothetical protein
MFQWDYNSDQPYRIKKSIDKQIYMKKNFFNNLKMYLSSFPLFIMFILKSFFSTGKKEIEVSDFLGVGVNLDKGKEQLSFLEELEIGNVNVRFPLWEIDKIDKYFEFIQRLQNYQILLTILQDREHIENHQLLEKNIEIIFSKFGDEVFEFQIGNAINRKKWGFFSIAEYLKFYKVVQKVRDEKFPNLELIGSAVIDFEFCNTIGTLYNFHKLKYDGISSLLYVDRRGSPENRQALFFNLKKKIDLLSEIVFFSPKTENRIYITETNYPIENTEPYTPTSQYEAVSLEDYTNYMIRYILISIATQKIDKVFWHQLISTGYGLIDQRNLQEYPQFSAFRTISKLLKNEEFISFQKKRGVYSVKFKHFIAYWSNGIERKKVFEENQETIDIYGNKTVEKFIFVSKKPIYIISNINKDCYI